MKLIELRDCILEDDRGYRKIAKEAGIMSKTTLGNFLKYLQCGKPEPSLHSILKIHALYCPHSESEIQVVVNYGFDYDLKASNLKEVMDYFFEKSRFDIVKILATKGKRMKNEMPHFSSIYELMAKARNGEITWSDLARETKNINYKHVQIEFLKEFLEALYLLNSQVFEDDEVHLKYVKLEKKCLSLLNNIEQLQGSFLYKKFKIRIKELLARALLKKGEYVEAKKIASYILDSGAGDRHKASAHYAYAMSHLFDDYNLCITHLQTAAELYLKSNLIEDYRETQFYIEFVSIFWEVPVEPTHSLNKAFLYLVQGNVHQAKKEMQNVNYTGYKFYIATIFRALCESSEMLQQNLLNQASNNFRKCGDYHFEQLPNKIFEKFNLKRGVYP
ncbi:AimR family lysis-lysogeny pheromone receptor [Jeotgalibacillus marinus]|uniref:AimR family lysis-lysogeny pheromone receptor n=1 Tax=Jeotgalibacillus marinus TaxID=86667 RepID=A0ABV3Q7P4_9BACL